MRRIAGFASLAVTGNTVSGWRMSSQCGNRNLRGSPSRVFSCLRPRLAVSQSPRFSSKRHFVIILDTRDMPTARDRANLPFRAAATGAVLLAQRRRPRRFRSLRRNPEELRHLVARPGELALGVTPRSRTVERARFGERQPAFEKGRSDPARRGRASPATRGRARVRRALRPPRLRPRPASRRSGRRCAH